MEAVRAANVLNGTDKDCTNWIQTYKDYKPAEGGARGCRPDAGQRAGRRRLAAAAAAAAAARPGWVGARATRQP